GRRAAAPPAPPAPPPPAPAAPPPPPPPRGGRPPPPPPPPCLSRPDPLHPAWKEPPMNSHPDQRRACAILTCLAEPADPLTGKLLRVLTPAGVLAMIRSGSVRAH